MTVPDFGITQTSLEARLPQIDVSSTSPITAARAAAQIQEAAAEVCAAIEATWGAGTSAIIDADTSSVAYGAAGVCVVTLCLPRYYLAAHHGADPEVLAQLTEAAEALRGRLARSPAQTIGYIPAPTTSLAAQTSTQGLELDTTSTPTAAPMRARWGGTSHPATSRGMQF